MTDATRGPEAAAAGGTPSGGPADGSVSGGTGDGGGRRDRTASAVPGAYDAEAVAAAARAADPGLTPGQALALARAAGRHLEGATAADAPELARRLFADDPATGATPAAVVARAAVDAWSLSAVDPA